MLCVEPDLGPEAVLSSLDIAHALAKLLIVILQTSRSLQMMNGVVCLDLTWEMLSHERVGPWLQVLTSKFRP